MRDARARGHRAKRLGDIPTCAGLMTRLAYAHARRRGFDVLPLLRSFRMAPKEIEDDTVPIAVTTQIDLLNRLAETLNDKLLGFHIGKEFDLRATGFLYYVAASSETLGDGLLKISRYSSIVNEGIAVKVQCGDTVWIVIDYHGVSRHADRHQIEAWITAAIRFCREMTGRALRPLRVSLMHERIPESEEIDAFVGREVEFGANLDELVLPAEVAGLPIVSFDPYLNRLLTKYCDAVLAHQKVPPDKLRVDVENAIAALLPHGQASIDNVADRLGISPRTLRRRLAAESTSFTRVLTDLRFALAKRYLAEQNISISRIAWLLGYTEVSTFSHAFKRWAGRPPRVARAAT